MTRPIQLVVLGGGPGGYAAAFLAADLGLSVTLIDQEENPGGVCLYRGCIPSKALLHAAALLNESREAAAWGIEFAPPKIHLDKLRSWKSDVVQKLTGGLGDLCRKRKITFVRGRASFTSSQQMKIELHGGGEQLLSFEQCILGTGSRPVVLEGIAPDSERILDSTSALEVEFVPKNLLVVGGGYIGLELATVYAALGSEVTVVEMTPGLLPGTDRDLVKQLEKRLTPRMHAIYLNTKVVKMAEAKNGIRVTFEGEGIKDLAAVFEKVLISVGRRPNSSGLGLSNTQVRVNDRGFVEVNEQCRTSDPHILAIGDLVGQPMLAHKASHEGRVAAEVVAGIKAAFEPAAIPAVVFTDPEIAWAGLTEIQAAEQKRDVKVARFPWAASGRALTLGRNDGVTKVIIEPETERILGMGICGPGAGELIAEGVLAIEMAASVTDLSMSIHPHPTLSETIMESAEVFFGHSTHYYSPKR